MATRINGTLRRCITLHGISQPVNILLTQNGVEMSVVGCRKRIHASWEHIAQNMFTSADVPSFLHGRAWKFLEHQAAEVTKKEKKIA